MKKTVIVHFQPLEKYPPLINMVRYLTTYTGLTLFTTENNEWHHNIERKNLKIVRLKGVSQTGSRASRLIAYLGFHTSLLFWLIANRPSKIIYYETLSSFSCVLYKLLTGNRTKLFIHYHEYLSPADYNREMLIARVFHRLEKWIYRSASWVSHTNCDRLKLFLSNEKLNNDENFQVMPNYPPKHWADVAREKHTHGGLKTIKMVYVGALSLKTMYLKEIIEFVNSQQGLLTCDFYSSNLSLDTREYINDNLKYGNLLGRVDYDNLPLTLSRYDVGLILYKGHIDNYVYNAPNKLFEYFALGLSVLFPTAMKGCYQYQREMNGFFCKAVNFDDISSIKINWPDVNFDHSINRDKFNCEEVYYKFKNVLLGT